MMLGRDERGHFCAFVLAAAAIHAALFVLGPSRAAAVAAEVPIVGVVNLDIESPMPGTAPTTPGGGATTADVAKAAKATPADRPAKAATPRRRDETISEPSPEGEPTADPSPSADPNAARAALESVLERRRSEAAMAAAAAAGARAGENGGPGGWGAGHGPPAIAGSNAFGNGTHGALTGRVCFLPVGTLRIADVRQCEYVATIYTDTLDIPERQFYDGFPGVTNRSEWFLIDYTGSFTVRRAGSYDFRLHSDDGSYLYVDDRLVIENDGKHAPESRSGSVELVAGRHRIKVRYAQTNDRMALQLFVRVPDASSESIFVPQL